MEIKTTAFGIASFCVTVMTIVIVLALVGRTEMEVSAKRNLTAILSSALKSSTRDKTIKTNEELQEAVLSEIAKRSNPNAEISVNFKVVDKDEGIVAVTLVQNYKKLSGKDGKIEYSKCVVLEQAGVLENAYTVKYEVREGLESDLSTHYVHKQYKISSGDPIPIPKPPSIPGKEFKGWTEETAGGLFKHSGELQQASNKDLAQGMSQIDRDYTFIAVFE